MNIYDFLQYCIDDSMLNVEIWDSDQSHIVYFCPADELPEELEYEEVSSFDVPVRADWITINIH